MSTDNINDLLKNPEQIKQMIGLLSTLLEAVNEQNNSDNSPIENTADVNLSDTQPINSRFIRKNNKKENRENKFLAMPEATMHKEDPEIAKKLYKQPPMARNRKNQTVKAKCRVCGKEEKIQSSLIYGGIERFKCNKCSATPG